MKTRNLLLVMAIAMFFCSCTTTKYYSLQPEYNTAYKNATKNQIIRSWGVPTRTVSMDDGEYVLVYEKYVASTTTNSYSNTYANANANAGTYYNSNSAYANVYGNSNNYSGSNTRSSNDRYYTEFYMGKNDKCYSVRTNDVYAKTETDKGMTALTIIGGIAYVAIMIGLLSSM